MRISQSAKTQSYSLVPGFSSNLATPEFPLSTEYTKAKENTCVTNVKERLFSEAALWRTSTTVLYKEDEEQEEEPINAPTVI